MDKTEKISFTLIAHNEEQNIKNCLESIKWADEIIVIDCDSTDKTVQIAKKYTNKIYYRKNNPNLNINKSYGIAKAKNNWIFYIDPDEVISTELRGEIKLILENNSIYSAFKIPRKNYFIFKFLKFGGNYPDYQLRFFKKTLAYFPNKHVHEKLIVNGKIGTLTKSLLHFPYKSIKEYIKKLNFYTDFQANYWFQHNKKVNFLNLLYIVFIKANIKFINKYFIKLGFLDSASGLFASLTNSFTLIISYFKLFELIKKK